MFFGNIQIFQINHFRGVHLRWYMKRIVSGDFKTSGGEMFIMDFPTLLRHLRDPGFAENSEDLQKKTRTIP